MKTAKVTIALSFIRMSRSSCMSRKVEETKTRIFRDLM